MRSRKSIRSGIVTLTGAHTSCNSSSVVGFNSSAAAEKMDGRTHERVTMTEPSGSGDALNKGVIGDSNIHIVNKGGGNQMHIGHDNQNNQGVVVNNGNAVFLDPREASDSILNELGRAPAYYDSSLRKQAHECMQDTRVAILTIIYEWADSTDDPPIFWLHGPAGTGKSTIAHTVAEECRKRGRLGASFFFAHANAECSNPNLFFSTIAYQLSKFDPDLRQHIINAVRFHPSPQDASMSTQLQRFILTPMRKLSNNPAREPIIVVVDAFDECSDARKASEILQLLSAESPHFPLRLKFFITSRPEPEIRSILHPDIHRISRSFDLLRDIDASSTDKDIKHFLRFHIGRIGKEYDLRSWPREIDVETLAQQAGGLFIFAHTAIELLRDKDFMDPESQLALLKSIGSDGAPASNLNVLYSRILRKAIPETASTMVQERVITIIHAIVGLRAPLPMCATERLFGFGPGAIRAALNRLRSIFIVPDNDEDTVQVIHPSFARYITDEESCTEKRFLMSPRQLHSQLAKHCLKQMKTHLKQNICNFKDFATVEAPIKDGASSDIDFQKLSAELRYSCEHFAAHVRSADEQDGELCEMVAEWANQYLLYWLEVLALIGSSRDALPSLRLLGNFDEIAPTFRKPITLESRSIPPEPGSIPRKEAQPQTRQWFLPKWLKTRTVASKLDPQLMDTQTSSQQLLLSAEQLEVPTVAPKQGLQLRESLQLLSDAIRMVSESYDDIKRFPSQIYTSCLAFCPLDSTLFKQYSRFSTVRVLSANRETWGPLLHAFKDPDGSVVSLTFSPDGKTLASHSSVGKILLWDLETGESRVLACHTLRRHTAFMFSPDGEFIAADGNVFRVTTGEEVLIPGICSAFSADGRYIAVGCADGAIRLHDTQASKLSLIGELLGHGDTVTTLIFSDTFLVSASSDDTIRMWNCSSQEMIKQIHDPSGNKVTFSPNGTYVAACYKSLSLGKSYLWVAHINSGEEKSIEVDLGSLNESMPIFFPGSDYVAFGNSAELYLVPATQVSSTPLRRKFTTAITSISFGPEQSLLVGNEQGMIRSREISKDEHSAFRLQFECKGHLGAVQAITFSRKGKHFASASIDGSICVWNVTNVIWSSQTNSRARPSPPQPQRQDVTFAPDGQTVTIRSDNIVSKMDAMTGHSIFHKECTLSVVARLSGDGKYLAAKGLQGLLSWDTGSSSRQMTPRGTGNRNPVTHALSPDGTHYAAQFSDGDLWVHDLRNGESREMQMVHPGQIHDGRLIFSHDSKRLVSWFGEFLVFDVEKGVQTDLNLPVKRHISSCTFSPCGQYIAITHDSGLDVLEYLSKQPNVRKVQRQGGYLYVVFSPDGKYMLAAAGARYHGERQSDLFHVDTLDMLYTVKSPVSRIFAVDQPMREFRRTGRLLNHPLFQPSEYNDFPYLLTRDGWVITASSKRLCRLPIANRGEAYDVNGNRIVVISREGKVTLIQFGLNPICIPIPV